jgi:hypothetical protein
VSTTMRIRPRREKAWAADPETLTNQMLDVCANIIWDAASEKGQGANVICTGVQPTNANQPPKDPGPEGGQDGSEEARGDSGRQDPVEAQLCKLRCPRRRLQLNRDRRAKEPKALWASVGGPRERVSHRARFPS